MQYNDFITHVQYRAGIDSRDHAEVAITATLETLGRRLSAGEASNVAAQLPGELQQTLDRAGGDAEGFDVDEFVQRVADREGLGYGVVRAAEHARAVLSTLASSVSAGEIEDVRSQLPSEYRFLMDQAP